MNAIEIAERDESLDASDTAADAEAAEQGQTALLQDPQYEEWRASVATGATVLGLVEWARERRG